MTIAGARFKNDSGIYQIDENSVVMSMMAYGSFSTLALSSGPAGSLKYTGTYVGELPTFAIYLPQGCGFFGGISKTSLSGSTWTFEILLWDVPGASQSVSISNAKWFVLGRPKLTGGSGAGMRLRDAAGNLRFSSFWKSKPIIGMEGQSLTNNRKYAFIAGTVAYEVIVDVDIWTDQTIHTTTRVNVTGLFSTSNGVQSNTYEVSSNTQTGPGGPSTGTTSFAVQQPAFVIDVTEY